MKRAARRSTNAAVEGRATDAIRFTLSVSPALVRGSLDVLATDHMRERLRELRHRIFDINFTLHVEPFVRDAHGVFLTPEENEAHLRQMLALQEATGITVSPVFNDIFVPNTEERLRRFLESLEPLVERGVRSVTVPHVLWMKMGLIRKRFPKLFIKNTVLRRVRTAQEFWGHAEAGYDYVNLDRVLVRDRRTLQEIRAAQREFEKRCGKRVVTSLLDGEGCLGTCPLFEEHHQHTLTHAAIDESLEASTAAFRLPTGFSCWAVGDPFANWWIKVGLPFFREDLEEVCRTFDVVKLAGRRSFMSLGDGLKKVGEFGTGRGPLVPGAPPELARLLGDKAMAPAIARWRKAVPTCRFQCWRCTVCSEIYARLA